MGSFAAAILPLVVSAALPGCSQYIDPNVPEPIRPFIEPGGGGDYLLYRPSNYDRRLAWPLVVVCHGSAPDSPTRQIRAWTQLAESHGFLVVAPALSVTRQVWGGRASACLDRQRVDETHILATIQHVRGAHNIADDRVFVHGWSTGAFAALHTGLRHPDVFRAISLTRPRFDTDYLGHLGERIDHHQPVYLHYHVADAVTGKNARRCAAWLRDIGVDVREDSAGPARKTDTSRAVDLYQNLIRTEPWIYIRAFPLPDRPPLEIQFKLRCSIDPARLTYHWQFGDGDESVVAEPVHLYARPGTYRVTVTLHSPDDTEHHRTLDLHLP